MEELILRKPTLEDEQAVMEYKAEFLADGSPLNGSSGLQKYDNYADWLEHLRQNEEGKTAGRVPATQYLAVRKSDGKIIGMLSLRHYYDEAILYFGGHIGDSVRPNERRKGYATQIIGLALDIYKEMGVEKVLISCITDNVASAKSIEKNGGVLENEVWYEEDQVTLKRYWIDNRKR